MARLPSDRYLIQQVGPDVILFEDGTEREIVRFNVSDSEAVANAQRKISATRELADEDRAFANFWSGYFYHAALSAWL
jgi:hypothetical protein